MQIGPEWHRVFARREKYKQLLSGYEPWGSLKQLLSNIVKKWYYIVWYCATFLVMMLNLASDSTFNGKIKRDVLTNTAE